MGEMNLTVSDQEKCLLVAAIRHRIYSIEKRVDMFNSLGLSTGKMMPELEAQKVLMERVCSLGENGDSSTPPPPTPQRRKLSEMVNLDHVYLKYRAPISDFLMSLPMFRGFPNELVAPAIAQGAVNYVWYCSKFEAPGDDFNVIVLLDKDDNVILHHRQEGY